MDARLQTDFIPGSFSERGLSVPFTTPLLAQARVRLAEDEKPEFVMPSFSGGKGRYVMPWATIQSVVKTTVHDRILFQRLGARPPRTPVAVRRVALEVAAKGLAGPKAAVAARTALSTTEETKVLTHFLLVERLLKLVHLSADDLMDGGPHQQVSRAKAKLALARIAEALRLREVDVYERIETLSSLLEPVGLADAPEPGRLRRLGGEIRRLSQELRYWSSTTLADVAALGLFTADHAERTGALVEQALGQLDGDLGDMALVLRDWSGRSGRLNRSVLRLQFLLDGWDYLVGLWREAKGRQETDLPAVVADLFRLAPIIPKNEMPELSSQQIADLSAVQRRWVRANEDWRTGRLDMAQVRRIESVRATVT